MHWTEMLLPLSISFAITISMMPIFIGYFKVKQFGQITREEGPKWHQVKSGTPTMGGVVFIIAAILTVIGTAIWKDVLTVKLAMLLFVLLFFAAIGFLDDFLKIFKKQNEGLTSKQKFLSQLVGIFRLCCVVLPVGFGSFDHNPILWTDPQLVGVRCIYDHLDHGFFERCESDRWIGRPGCRYSRHRLYRVWHIGIPPRTIGSIAVLHCNRGWPDRFLLFQ